MSVEPVESLGNSFMNNECLKYCNDFYTKINSNNNEPSILLKIEAGQLYIVSNNTGVSDSEMDTNHVIECIYKQIYTMAIAKDINISNAGTIYIRIYFRDIDKPKSSSVPGMNLHRNVVTLSENNKKYKSFLQTLFYLKSPQMYNNNNRLVNAPNNKKHKTYFIPKYVRNTRNGQFYKTPIPTAVKSEMTKGVNSNTIKRNYNIPISHYTATEGRVVQFISPIGYHQVSSKTNGDNIPAQTRRMIITHLFVDENSTYYNIFKTAVGIKSNTFNVKRNARSNQPNPTKYKGLSESSTDNSKDTDKIVSFLPGDLIAATFINPNTNYFNYITTKTLNNNKKFKEKLQKKIYKLQQYGIVIMNNGTLTYKGERRSLPQSVKNFINRVFVPDR